MMTGNGSALLWFSGSKIYSDREQERYKCEFIVGDTEAYDVSIEF